MTVAHGAGPARLHTFGYNEDGALGNGTTSLSNTPLSITGDVVGIAGGFYHSLFLKADGTLWGMGRNTGGQLGDNTTTSRLTPVLIASGVASFAAGDFHSLFVKTDGSLWAMGNNDHGQLGIGSTDFAAHPVPVQIATGVATAHAGYATSFFIKTDGSLWAMGWNAGGRLGDGTGETRNSPVFITGGVASVSSRQAHTLIVKTDGTLWAAGENTEGQLGDGTTTLRLAPVLIATDVSTASAGETHSLFIKTDGSLWAMGSNAGGQLALGFADSVVRSTPVQVATGISAAAAGVGRTHFIKTDGSLWSVGLNTSGQLGDGFAKVFEIENPNVVTPVRVAGGVTAIATGGYHTLTLANVATLPPVITRGTDDGVAPLGRDVYLNIAVGGTAPFTYTWYRGAAGDTSTPVPLATEKTFVLPMTGAPVSVWVRVSNAAGSVSSRTITYTALPAPVITKQPGNVNIVSGATATFSVNVTGDQLTYQWFRGASGDTSNQVFPNATGPTYTTLPLTANTPYWVRVSNPSGSVNSATGSVTIVAPPTLTTAPLDAFIVPGGNATFTISGNGIGLTYQWYEGATGDTSAPLAGATAATFTTPALATSKTYWVRISTIAGSVDSPTARAVITSFPTITTPPAATSVGYLENARLDVAATGEGLSYQWYRGATGDTSAPVAGATSELLLTPPLKTGGSYWVRITNPSGTINSAAANVTVAPAESFYLHVFGSGIDGRLGLGTVDQRTTPFQIATDVAAVAVGANHTLFLKTDGSLWAAGDNSSGQLGDGTTADRRTPFRIANGVSRIAAGNSSTLFLKTDGTLWAAGTFATLFTGTTTLSPVQIAADVADVAAGHGHYLFVKTDATLWTGGSNQYGQLGDGTTITRNRPVQIATGVRSAGAAGIFHSHYIKTDGSLWGMGWNSSGQLGDGSTIDRLSPVSVAADVVSVSASFEHTFFLKTNGEVWAMGSNSSSQPILPGASGPRPTPVLLATGVSAHAAAGQHLVKTDGSLLARGFNNTGQLGDGSTINRTTFVSVASQVRAVVSSGSHTAFIKTDGSLWVTGANNKGQLGDGVSTQATPVALAGDVTRIAASDRHSLFIRADGSLWAMGWNGYGQLGDGSSTTRSVPVSITNDVVAISAAEDTSFFIKADGTLWAAGNNTAGKLGDGSTSPRSTPVLIAAGVAAVSAGPRHTHFIKTDGSLWAMGDNTWGALGDGTTINRATPVRVATRVIAVDNGLEHTAFLTADGSLRTAGRNAFGQFGVEPRDFELGTAATFRTPHLMVPASYWVRVTNLAGSVDSPAARLTPTAPPAGTLHGFGNRGHGRLGDGYLGQPTDADATALQSVVIATDVVSVAAGVRHTLFIKTDGSLWGMGDNAAGQLGDGTTVSRRTPVRIVASDVVAAFVAEDRSYFIKADGTLRAAGANVPPEFAGSTNLHVPVQVAAGVVSAAVNSQGGVFTVRADRTMWQNYAGGGPPQRMRSDALAVVSGSNFYVALLAEGTVLRVSSFSASSFDGINDAIAISAGGDHSAILHADRTLSTVDRNTYGQRGNGTTSPLWLTTPSKIATDVTSFAAGGNHTLFARADGTLWATGLNNYGQLGDGSTINRTTPIRIANGVISVFAGGEHTLVIATGNGPLAPVVTAATSSRPVDFGRPVALTVVAAGGGPLAYQWYRGTSGDTSRPIAGATEALYTVDRIVADGSFWARVSNASGSADTATVELTVVAPTTFAQWTSALGLSGTSAQPGADEDHDAIPTLAEYAFGTAPGIAATTAERPALELTQSGDAPSVLTYRHRRAKTAQVAWTYQTSTDLSTWTTVQTTPTVITPDADGDGAVEIVAITIPLGGAERLFVRAVVSPLP